MSHAPQLLGSLVVSTHPLVHCVKPGKHVEAHTELLHDALAFVPAVHTASHAPQLFGSLVVSVQPLVHCVNPGMHDEPHTDAVHVG